MNHDNYFGIGSSHKICEDYALSGTIEDCGYAIVSDGCSSSKESDVGARLLAHIAKDAIGYMQRRKLLYDFAFLSDSFKTTFEEIIMKKCLEVRETLRFSYNIFDATLLIAISIANKWAVLFSWGDGHFILKRRSGATDVIRLEYESGAPYYMSYELSQDKKTAYETEYGDKPLMKTIDRISQLGAVNYGSHDIIENPMCRSYFAVVSDLDTFSSLIVSSDGIGTFQDDPRAPVPTGKEERQKYTALQVIPELTAYKNPVGEFVTRRMNRVNQDYRKAGVVHLDDVSFAALSLID